MGKSIITNTIILTITTTIIRILGFLFRIYIANKIGAEGMGILHLVFSFYILTVTFAISGITMAVSRITAEQIAKKNERLVKKCLHISLSICFFTSLIATLILYFGAKPISLYLIKDTRAFQPLIYLSPSLMFLSFSACFRGYFIAKKNIFIPTTKQFLEQIIRISVTFILLKSINISNIENCCSVVTLGMSIGEIFSFIYIFLLYKLTKKRKKVVHSTNNVKITKSILNISLPIAGTSYIDAVLRLVENSLIPIKLVEHGYLYKTAISMYGMVKGMVLPLLFFPTSFLSSLATMLIPTLSSHNALNNHNIISLTISKVLHFTLIIATLLVGIFVTFPNELGKIIYNNTTIGYLIKIISFVCPFLYIDMILSSVLNALGHQLSTFKINFFESTIKICLIYFLVPIWGLNAYIFALLLTTFLNSVMYTIKLLKETTIIFDINNWIIKPIFSIIISCIISKFIFYKLLNYYFGIVYSTFASIFILTIFYFIITILIKCIKKKDIYLIKNSVFRRKFKKN